MPIYGFSIEPSKTIASIIFFSRNQANKFHTEKGKLKTYKKKRRKEGSHTEAGFDHAQLHGTSNQSSANRNL